VIRSNAAYGFDLSGLVRVDFAAGIATGGTCRAQLTPLSDNEIRSLEDPARGVYIVAPPIRGEITIAATGQPCPLSTSSGGVVYTFLKLDVDPGRAGSSGVVCQSVASSVPGSVTVDTVVVGDLDSDAAADASTPGAGQIPRVSCRVLGAGHGGVIAVATGSLRAPPQPTSPPPPLPSPLPYPNSTVPPRRPLGQDPSPISIPEVTSGTTCRAAAATATAILLTITATILIGGM
jgi:hypothetical protein